MENFEDTDDLLGSMESGGEDEGIVNFLSDAIGQDVGTEVLREFSNSDAFAELLDVVTSSLIPTSGRVSNEDSEELVPVQSEEIPSSEIVNLDPKLKTALPVQTVSCDGVSESQNDGEPHANEINENISIPEKIIDKRFEEIENSDSILPSESDRKIQNRLKICLKTSFTKKHRKSPKNKETPKTPQSYVENSNRSRQNSPEKSSSNLMTDKSKMKVNKHDIKSTQRLHKKCLLVHRDEEFTKYSATLKLNPCCVILCDLLNMGSSFRETNCLGGGGDAALSFISVKNLVFMTERKIEETLTVEKIKRQSFAQKLNPLTIKKGIQNPKLLSVDSGSSQRNPFNQKQVQTEVDDTEIEQIIVSPEDTKIQQITVPSEEPVKFKKELKPAEKRVQNLTDDEESDEVTNPKRNKTTRNPETEAPSSTENETKDKSQAFGRQRDKDDVRARKFDKFEYERKRKFTDRKGERIKKEIKPAFKPENPFRQAKTLSSSFKIPKKNTQYHYVDPEDLQVSTPLAKQEIPSENLKFERFKKGKGEEKDSNFKKRDWIPRSRRFEQRSKMDFDVPDSDRLQLPPLEVKADIEPTWEDEPEGQGSVFGDRSTESQIPPLLEVQAGDLAVEVTELLREGTKAEIPTMEDFSCATDSTAQKCAWWFTKAEKEPPSEGDCQMPYLEEAPSFSSENGSNCSFIGNVSNPGSEADCQVNEISSTNRLDLGPATARDPDKVDEYCGRSLLQAKIRIRSSELFQNIFDLRAGALYEKENFQAKCNLCNQLVVGRRELAVHVRGVTHKDKLRKMDPTAEKSALTAPSVKVTEKISKEDNYDDWGDDPVIIDKTPKVKEDPEDDWGDPVPVVVDKTPKVKESPKGGDPVSTPKNYAKVQKDEKDRKEKKNNKEKLSKKNGKKDRNVLKEPAPVKKEPTEMVFARTSTGLEIKVPVLRSNRQRSGSPPNFTRSRSKNRSRSRSRERRRRNSRSPIRRIPRSPIQIQRSSRRSRSRSPRRGSRTRITSSEEKVKAFLARTNRSRSPANGYHSKRSRRSRTRSRSPQISMKKDNREFHEKLALTADGKWNDEMEKRWKLMEAEEAMFRERFYDRRKSLIAAPEEHPKYGEEWREFWERRYQEVEQLGKDPDSYDYVTEWKEFWAKRLNILLQDEADGKITEIKKTYGMDFASLSKLRNSDTTPTKPEIKIEPIKSEPAVVKLEVGGISGSCLDKVSLEDFATRSMSISDVDIDISKIKGVKQPPERKPSVTVEDFKSKWELLTRQKVEEEVAGSLTDGLSITPNKQGFVKRKLENSENAHSIGSKRRVSQNVSEFPSSSEASYDFDGFDLAQVLRLMCKLEDQLSFLAPKVLEYFKLAEELELAKSRGSHTLLDNEELVTVLFQSRDRFMTMIRSNILSKDVLKSLNLTVYALNAILDAPQCQKFRLKVPISLPEVEKSVPELKKEVNKMESLKIETHLEDFVAKKNIVSDATDDDEIGSAIANLPFEMKKLISAMLAKFLVANGRENIGDKGLKEFIRKVLTPVLRYQSVHLKPEPSSSKNQHNDLKGNVGTKLEFSTEQPPTYASNNITNELQGHSASSRLYSVSSSRAVGSALPTFSSMMAGAVEPLRDSIDPSKAGKSRQSPTRTGRRSPFSRRDYTGNPVANTGRL